MSDGKGVKVYGRIRDRKSLDEVCRGRQIWLSANASALAESGFHLIPYFLLGNTANSHHKPHNQLSIGDPQLDRAASTYT